ncbi:dimethylmenaquinone methyltransferase [Sphaerisporangium siamense]|uniref:FAD/FMN-containing dehydrogenase/Fe-S oxidoreductase n=1 Tax=Sphaerisporangium siamense TaxID=795645 RepID=A0A7W7GA67_9ACTN|nr:FAD-binding and (Fe-S)-binding domain-containing protein [Sphaerisporangium siamense]MBB4699641.1 FAD/FMN-containing dehydrogenase/Fe-S oxidoreductase [Sphaerisporangium siamense]GII89664.1 dimethylmenaquinone methyltransferase [Sphaerisporangium siamense]
MSAVTQRPPGLTGRRPEPAAPVDVAALRRDLEAAVHGEVRFDATMRGAYSTDASNYRQIPLGVVCPRTVEAAVAAVAVCRRHGAPLLSRGGGTSLAGECTNTAVVLDWSKYCHRLLDVDAEARTCLVEPGIVLDTLNARLAGYGLEFGPRPATHDHCTIGGMIGNNSCGSTAQRTGKVVDNLVEMEVLLYDGTRMWVGETGEEEYAAIRRQGGRRAEIYARLRELRDAHLERIRTGYPDIPRRVSGYNLDSLLPERRFNVGRALVGSEGTLVVVLRARLALVPVVKARTMIYIAYPDIAAAADAVPAILPHKPVALEGVDDKLIHFERMKHLNSEAVSKLPAGGAWLLVQMGGEDKDDADRAADAMLRDLGKSRGGPGVGYFDDERLEEEMWLIRESGLGATARVPGLPDTWPGWEDSAVAPDRLGDYLRDLQGLYERYGLRQASLYGHFGQGCVHTRIPFALTTAAGVAGFRSFMEEAADLVVSYGGSLSGEHGDGQARGELLSKMFGDELVHAFGRFKAIFDPDDRMNPGKVVKPYPLDGFLRLGADYNHGDVATHFKYPDDEGSFGRAVLRCVGVGRCRREHGGVMCPSYMVTRAEEHSTRGRARLLFEMLDGSARGGAVTEGWRSKAVHEALDLCLACKGCKSDCPVNVDMATYKAEFLSHHFAGRLRPRAHYSMGWLPVWAVLASRAPRVVNVLAHAPLLGRLAKAAAGVDRRREPPLFAPRTFQDRFARRRPGGDGTRGEVLLWPDTFTNHFHTDVADAAVEVLESAGWRVRVPRAAVCCGLTWISTGQLATAKRVLRRTVAELRPAIQAGLRVVALEPSCAAVLRGDATELFPDDEDVRRLSRQTVTLAELLRDHTPGWRPPKVPRSALVQVHCHQHAILKHDADEALLRAAGVDAHVLDSGCCGLAGNFGFERGHYEVSEACAERVLLPAVREADPSAVILADGFSCRTQLEQSDADGRAAVHLAQLLRAGLRGDQGDSPRPEGAFATWPRRPSLAVRACASAGVAAVLLAGLALGARRVLRG